MIKSNIDTRPTNSSNINIINDNDNKEKEKNLILKTKIILKYDFIKKESNKDITLFDLKKFINTKFNMQEYDYELFIAEHNINCLSNDTSILNLLNKYKLNKKIIKAFKNVVDILNELNYYEKFLTKKISSKEDEIIFLKKEHEKLTEDLKNIQ